MGSARLLELFHAITSQVHDRKLPLGGIQTILVGHWWQLKPVADKFYDGEPMYKSVLFPSLFPRTIQLTIVHRQNEREVVYCNILHSFVWEGVMKQFTGTPDWFFTNRSKLITLSQLPMVGSSDHYTILAKPVSAPITTHTTEKSVVRDMRDSAWRAFGRWITQKDWTPILNASSCEQKFQLLMSELDGAISIFLPQKISKKHPTDRPWITSKIKMWICKRQSAFSRHGYKKISWPGC